MTNTRRTSDDVDDDNDEDIYIAKQKARAPNS